MNTVACFVKGKDEVSEDVLQFLIQSGSHWLIRFPDGSDVVWTPEGDEKPLILASLPRPAGQPQAARWVEEHEVFLAEARRTRANKRLWMIPGPELEV